MRHYKTIQVNKKQVMLHRHLMEIHLNRKLLHSELVHHINEDIYDNRIENLEVLTRSEHKKKHPYIGKETRFKNIYNFKKDTIIELYKTKTIQEISDIYGCYPMTVWSFMKKNNIKTKKRGRRNE